MFNFQTVKINTNTDENDSMGSTPKSEGGLKSDHYNDAKFEIID